MKTAVEKGIRPREEIWEEIEFFRRDWKQTTILGAQRPGRVRIKEAQPADRLVQIDFFNFQEPYTGSHYAKYARDAGWLELQIGEHYFVIGGLNLFGRGIVCEPVGRTFRPEGWYADEDGKSP